MEGILALIVKVIFIVSALLMTFLILLQEGQGGGLAALGGTKAASVEGVTNPIRRATAYLAGIFFLLAVVLASLARGSQGSQLPYDEEKAPEVKKQDAEAGGGASAAGTENKPEVSINGDVKAPEVDPVKDIKDAVKDVKNNVEGAVKEGEALKDEVKKAGGNIDDALKSATETLKKIDEEKAPAE